jgi:tripeptidyl-peptidase-1
MKFHILPAALWIAIVSCAPAGHHVIHERRERGSEWLRRDVQVDRNAVLPTISIGLTQQLLQVGEQFLLDVSDPTSASYGQHWTPKQVVDTFAPDEDTINAVKSWLVDSGISEDRIVLTPSRTWLRMNLTVAEAETLLKTEYRVFEHKETAKRALAVEEYSVPAHIQRHIDYITPTLEPTTLTKNKPRDGAGAMPVRVWKQPPKFKDAPTDTPPLHIPSDIQVPSDIQARDTAGVNSYAWDTSICSEYITRACIQAMYNIPNGTLTTSSLAVIELFTTVGAFRAHPVSIR